MGLLLLIILLILLLGSWPTWAYSRGWGYRSPSILGILLGILVFLMLFRVVVWW